jgi:glutamate-5-semialdehyde dehydrogenase
MCRPKGSASCWSLTKRTQAAQVEVAAGRMSGPLFNRLDLGKGDRWESMLKGVSDVAALPDPAGNVSYASELDDDLKLYRVSCPIGVLLVIFESRPEVVVNIAALAVKSGKLTALLVFILPHIYSFLRQCCDSKGGERE